MDIFDKNKRSWLMSRVESKNTKPEIIIRSLIHQMGHRFRLYQNNLPGKPDIVLKRHRKIVFVNGCFWHGHDNCSRAKLPESNFEFWAAKIKNNKKRDHKNIELLRNLGWEVLVVWQCEMKNQLFLVEKLKTFLNNDRK